MCIRDSPRVYALATAAHARGEDPRAMPDRYVLGPGHVRFFYARLGYIVRRHRELIAEMLRRGYNASYRVVLMPEVPDDWCQDWEPTEAAVAANIDRIKARTHG